VRTVGCGEEATGISRPAVDVARGGQSLAERAVIVRGLGVLVPYQFLLVEDGLRRGIVIRHRIIRFRHIRAQPVRFGESVPTF